MGDRVVDCARLESVCAERHRGFESPPIRRVSLTLDHAMLARHGRALFSFELAFFDYLQFLPQLKHSPAGKHAAKVYTGINHAIPSDH